MIRSLFRSKILEDYSEGDHDSSIWCETRSPFQYFQKALTSEEAPKISFARIGTWSVTRFVFSVLFLLLFPCWIVFRFEKSSLMSYSSFCSNRVCDVEAIWFREIPWHRSLHLERVEIVCLKPRSVVVDGDVVVNFWLWWCMFYHHSHSLLLRPGFVRRNPVCARNRTTSRRWNPPAPPKALCVGDKFQSLTGLASAYPCNARHPIFDWMRWGRLNFSPLRGPRPLPQQLIITLPSAQISGSHCWSSLTAKSLEERLHPTTTIGADTFPRCAAQVRKRTPQFSCNRIYQAKFGHNWIIPQVTLR